MKEYKKVELKAKNAPMGSYAAGCPTKGGTPPRTSNVCKSCEVAW